MSEEDRNLYIINNLIKKARIVEDKGYTLLALFLQGSQNYELDIYQDDYRSDIDCKAIVIPSFKDIVMNKPPVSTTLVLDNNEHIELKDIRVMKEMWIKQNVSYIELLYTKYVVVIGEDANKFVNELRLMKDDIANINKNQFLRCIRGMSMEKFKALEHPYPTIKDKIDKYGYDPKQLHHIMRLFEFVIRYLDGEPLEKCYISNDKEYLLDIKRGKESLERARVLAETHNKLINDICKRHETEEDVINVDTIDKLNDWLYRVLGFYLRKELIDDGSR